jgi:glycolate oxidase FAD binding subunit
MDATDALLDAVARARADGQPVTIGGSGSKSHLAGTGDGEIRGRLLSTADHSGIVDHRPEELVVTVRSGTPLQELRQALARERQMLPFEPPEYRGLGTIGGAVASGLAGPGRPWRGGVRDAVLGVIMVNGLAERLAFGGRVMKNVAGFDVSRLQAGAWGTLGLLLEISLKVLPMPAAEETRILEVGAQEALVLMRRWARLPLPVTATAWAHDRLSVRLSGAEVAVLKAGEQVGGERGEMGYWDGLKNHTDAVFAGHGADGGRLWRRHTAPAVPFTESESLVEWSGGRRWLRLPQAEKAEGAIPFETGFAARIARDAGGDVVLADYQKRLKAAFDPDGLFNPEIHRADLAA